MHQIYLVKLLLNLLNSLAAYSVDRVLKAPLKHLYSVVLQRHHSLAHKHLSEVEDKLNNLQQLQHYLVSSSPPNLLVCLGKEPLKHLGPSHRHLLSLDCLGKEPLKHLGPSHRHLLSLDYLDSSSPLRLPHHSSHSSLVSSSLECSVPPKTRHKYSTNSLNNSNNNLPHNHPKASQ
jgi:hypothetical protein